MAENTAIEWCDHTFNPWWGCVEVSPGCDNCYARAMDARLKPGGQTHWGKSASLRKFQSEKYWSQIWQWHIKALKANTRRKVFCGSMCDVMEDSHLLTSSRAFLFYEVDQTRAGLDWLLLTKRPQNFGRLLREDWLEQPRSNVWLLTTVESAAQTWRIDELVKTPAVVRGLSCEPLLGPLDLEPYLATGGIHWVIAGGESGRGARPAKAEWFRSLRDQCHRHQVAFFFKQWGAHDENLVCIGKHQAGRLLDGQLHNEFPQPILNF